VIQKNMTLICLY